MQPTEKDEATNGHITCVPNKSTRTVRTGRFSKKKRAKLPWLVYPNELKVGVAKRKGKGDVIESKHSI
jgi:hypothetical protein